MEKLIITFTLLFTFSAAGNAMASNTKTVQPQSPINGINANLTFFAGRQVNTDQTEKEFKIESIHIDALGDSCTVTIKGKTKIRKKKVTLTISATAATYKKALEMAFNGVEAINKGEED